MDTDTAEIVRWLRGRALLEEAGLTKNVLAKAADTIERQAKELAQAKQNMLTVADAATKERDAALAEIERLKVQRDKAMAIGGVNFCAACGDEPVLEELQDSDIPGLGRTFCQKCRVAIGQSDFAS